MSYSMIIKNGRLLDKAAGLDCVTDIALSDGVIAHIGSLEGENAPTVVDAAGCIVTPGLIDMHAHIYPLLPTGIPAEAACFSTGVTTCVDAGSSGCGTYPYFRAFINDSKLRMKVFLNVATAGIINHPSPEDVDPASFNIDRIRDVLDRCGDEIMGLKIRISRPIVREFGLKPLEKTLEIAEKLNKLIMVHPTDPPCAMETVLDMLRPGDILAHMYHNIGPTIIDGTGHVCESAWRARERGVIFDCANDRQHFGFSTAVPAMRDGFLPDIITSDLTALDMFRYPTIFSLPMLASKYIMLGMKIEDVLYRMTAAPAKLMGIENETGSLREGLCADVAVFKEINKTVEFGDKPYGHPDAHFMTCDKLLKPMMTVRNGVTVFRDCEL